MRSLVSFVLTTENQEEGGPIDIVSHSRGESDPRCQLQESYLHSNINVDVFCNLATTST